MNFDFTDDQQAIKRTARDLLADRFKPDTVRELAEAERYDEAHWREIAELGWAGIFVNEQHGGQGLGMVELAILAEELGYAVAPLPFLANAAAGIALQHAGSDAQRERWLPGIASGAQRGAAGLMRNGVAPLVPDADSASAIVLFENGSATVLEPGDCEIAPRVSESFCGWTAVSTGSRLLSTCSVSVAFDDRSWVIVSPSCSDRELGAGGIVSDT